MCLSYIGGKAIFFLQESMSVLSKDSMILSIMGPQDMIDLLSGLFLDILEVPYFLPT